MAANADTLLRVLGSAVLVALGLIAFTPMPNLIGELVGSSEEPAQADAIVVLGAGMYADGELSRASLRRAVQGIELYHLDFARKLFLFGPQRYEDYPSEAQLRSRLAERMQVNPADVLVETRARTTRDEARLAAERLEPLGIQSILLVTDGQHLVRARELFENVGFQVFPVPASDYSRQPTSPQERIVLMKRIAEEQLARLYYRAAGYL